ncbi:MAG: hypothetical protein ACOH2E_07175 [Candidatus Paracaedibacter sp.]
MTTLILEENQILENDHQIADLSIFLKRLPPKTEITLILKSHDALYHLCPLRKAVPFLKSAEYSPHYWTGEKRLPKGQTFIGGLFPSPFVKAAINVIAEHSFPIKGIFLWADLIAQAYGPFDTGWTLIWHNHHLLICKDGILRISRSCYLPLAQELPAILRYLKRFGYEEEMPITLLKSSIFAESLPPFIHSEIRIPQDLSLRGLTLEVPELTALQRISTWSRKTRALAYGVALLNILGGAYFGWQIKITSVKGMSLKEQIGSLPVKDPLDEAKIQAFNTYCLLSKNRPNPLPLIRQLIPLMREEAVATYLQWTANPLRLTLHLELKPSTVAQELVLTLQSELRNHKLSWEQQEEEPLKGILTIEQRALEKQEGS